MSKCFADSKQFGSDGESKLKMASDQDITQLLLSKRHVEAFDMLLGSYQDKVFRLAWSMLGNHEQAEDAAQEIFLRIWKSLSRYRGESALGTWIYSIARNACLTAIARRAARPTVPLKEAGHPAATAAAEEPRADVIGLVAQLPEKHRQVVMLYYMEDKSYEEVARILELPLGTVKTYLHRGRKQLATMIREMKETTDAVRRI